MSLGIDARVVYKTLNNCFISVPSSFIYPILDSTNLLVQQIIFHISDYNTDERIVSIGWSGNTSKESNTIEIDTQYAKLIDIKENSTVRVDIDLMLINELNSKANLFSTIEIDPLTTSDWELTEIYAQAIESNFLSQVRCVCKNQKLLIHANPNSSSNTGSITFKVVKIKLNDMASDFAKIGNDTELHIIPKPHNLKSAEHSNDKESLHKKKNSIGSRKTSLVSPTLIKRCIINEKGLHYTVYGRNKNPTYENVKFVQISVLEGAGTPKRGRRTTEKEKQMGISDDMFGTTVLANYTEILDKPSTDAHSYDIFDETQENSISVSPLLAISLGIENTCGEKVVIEPYNRKSMKLDIVNCKLVIHKLTDCDKSLDLNDDNKLELKKGNILKNKRIVQDENKINGLVLQKKLIELFGMNSPLTNGMKLPIIETILPQGGVLEVQNETLNKISELKNSKTVGWTLLGLDDGDEMLHSAKSYLPKLKFGKDILVPQSRIQKLRTQGNEYEIFGHDEKVELVMNYLSDCVPTFLYGKSGSGKTLFCKHIANKFKANGIYTKVIDFDHTFIKSSDDDEGSDENENDTANKMNSKNKYVAELFEKVARQCFWRSPSLLVLENLDKIIFKEVEHGDNGGSTQLTEILIQKFDQLVKERHIILLITSKSKDSINQKIFQKHFVDEEIGIEAPNKHQISEILLKLLQKKYPKYLDNDIKNFLTDVASELDGYFPLDLMTLIDRAFHNMISNEQIVFQQSHFMAAVEGYTPTSLRGVKLQKSLTNWADIGGLTEVKRVLLETLEWPTKYAPIFAKCSLRLRSGILLYGYPGCGKTMLASAISSQCGLNFISVKGPEILNKYIGASEQSIRELFERAQSAKPCILFFDEFDSIAPKRGHDSTGVTDRIVNQLLTQMDGAEGLEGVYVLAATSRPDLIDSALLRPGRLDKSVICDLPNYEDRLDILKTIVKSNSFYLKNFEELKDIARLTYGYTGADLQAVVYNAYLKCVHVRLDEITESQVGTTSDGVNVEFMTKMPSLESSKREFFVSGDMKKKVNAVVENLNIVNISDDGVALNEVSEKAPIYITLNQLKESLGETKKSISTKELKKLEKIYGQFESSKRPGEMKDGEGSTEVGVRSSLM